MGRTGIGYSAVFGSTNIGINIGYGVAVDVAGERLLVGSTTSAGFPTISTNSVRTSSDDQFRRPATP